MQVQGGPLLGPLAIMELIKPDRSSGAPTCAAGAGESTFLNPLQSEDIGAAQRCSTTQHFEWI
jgi:hypothetical protein